MVTMSETRNPCGGDPDLEVQVALALRRGRVCFEARLKEHFKRCTLSGLPV
jgi:hypothetical protein